MLQNEISQIAERLRGLRQMTDTTPEEMAIDFHYCPLVAAWKKLGATDEECAELCQIAMDGDRGSASTFPPFDFHLGKTIAAGDDICDVRFKKV